MLSVNNTFISSFPIYIHFVSFFCLIILPRISNMMLKRSGERDILALFLEDFSCFSWGNRKKICRKKVRLLSWKWQKTHAALQEEIQNVGKHVRFACNKGNENRKFFRSGETFSYWQRLTKPSVSRVWENGYSYIWSR